LGSKRWKEREKKRGAINLNNKKKAPPLSSDSQESVIENSQPPWGEGVKGVGGGGKR